MTSDTAESHLGKARLDPSRRRLLLDGKPAKLGARAFDLLYVLAQHRERAVSKHELFERVWPGLVVEDNNLQVQISTLRKLLGAEAILTIPGRGYQLTAAIDATDEPPAARTAANEIAHTAQPLYGRGDDLLAIQSMLVEHRVVSIVGAGGIGKTVLARAVVEEARWADGIWWVELGPLADAALVAGAVASALGITVSRERPALHAVLGVLRDKSGLLVLDNAEHLIDAVAELVEAVHGAAPAVRILVTSQEVLRSPAESVYRLGPLGVNPEAGQPAGAVELFAARARAADPRLAFDAPDLAIAREICQDLDGIPLAIELAAARVPLLGLDGLRARLGERFHILTAGARTVLRRHQTLRAALEWSHGLLSNDERAIFRRLGIFAGGFTLELAQEVAADERINRWTVLDLLGHLVDKSLVVAEGFSVPRYRLLETTRAYAVEQLAAADETIALLRRHAIALTRFLEPFHAMRWRLTPEQRRRAGTEIDNVRAALEWARAADTAIACELGSYSGSVWIESGQHNEGVHACLRLLPLPPEVLPADEARLHLTIARLGYASARRECFDAGHRAADMYATLDDAASRTDALIYTAHIGSHLGESAVVEAAIRQASRLVSDGSPRRQLAALALAEALWHAMCGRHLEAAASAQRQAALYRANGDEMGVWLAEGNTAFHECGLGEYERAIDRLHRALEGLRRLDAAYGQGFVLVFLCIAHAMRGDTEVALQRGKESVPFMLKHGWLTWALQGIVLAHAKRGAHRQAATLMGFVEADFNRHGFVPRPLETRLWQESRSLMLSALGADEIDRLKSDGEALSEEWALELAFDRDPTSRV